MKEFFKKIFSKESMKKFFYSFIWLMILIFAIDIITKWAFQSHFNGIETGSKDSMIKIIPDFLYIGLKYNEGAAWSVLSNARPLLIVISVVLGGGLIAYYIYSTRKNKTNTVIKVALALMIAGAVGNLIDRAFYWESTTGFNGVIDWIQVYFGDYAFPTFNIADSSLVVGVIVLLVYVIIDGIKESIKASKEGKFKYSPKELEAKENEENKDK